MKTRKLAAPLALGLLAAVAITPLPAAAADQKPGQEDPTGEAVKDINRKAEKGESAIKRKYREYKQRINKRYEKKDKSEDVSDKMDRKDSRLERAGDRMEDKADKAEDKVDAEY